MSSLLDTFDVLLTVHVAAETAALQSIVIVGVYVVVVAVVDVAFESLVGGPHISAGAKHAVRIYFLLRLNSINHCFLTAVRCGAVPWVPALRSILRDFLSVRDLVAEGVFNSEAVNMLAETCAHETAVVMQFNFGEQTVLLQISVVLFLKLLKQIAVFFRLVLCFPLKQSADFGNIIVL